MQAMTDQAILATTGHIKVGVADRVAVVTLDRPEKCNSMSYAMWAAMPGIFASLEGDSDVRAILLTGAGSNFCAGADISEFAEHRASVQQAAEYEAAIDACSDAIANVSKPTIAVINGYCLGGGAHLAMACDFRYASATASIGIPAARLSVVYGVKGTQRLLALVGLARAKKILLGACRLDADEALQIGLFDHVAEGSAAATAHRGDGDPAGQRVGTEIDPMIDAGNFARTLCDNAPLSIRGSKAILNALAVGPGALPEQQAAVLIAQAAASHDYREGRTAFVEKRRPEFIGR